MIWLNSKWLNLPIYVVRMLKKPRRSYPGIYICTIHDTKEYSYKNDFSLAHKVDDDKVQELLNEMLTIKKFQG